MKKKFIIIAYSIIIFFSFLNAAQSNDFRMNYKDGTVVICQPQDKTLLIKTDYDFFKVPFSRLDRMEFKGADDDIVITLKNGDRISGKIITYSFKVDTTNGEVDIQTNLLKSIARVSAITTNPPVVTLPAEPIKFCGFTWMPWRRSFELKDSRLMTLPSSRKGFVYGHNGHGRDAVLVTNVGNKQWKDYCVQFNFGMLPVDPGFNPLTLATDFKRVYLLFHISDHYCPV